MFGFFDSLPLFHFPLVWLSPFQMPKAAGLVPYGPNFPDLFRRAVEYIDRDHGSRRRCSLGPTSSSNRIARGMRRPIAIAGKQHRRLPLLDVGIALVVTLLAFEQALALTKEQSPCAVP